MKKEDKKQANVYIICPRCELNYINKKDKYCTVCKAELGLVDPSILIPDEEEAGVEKLCPICHVNYIAEDEEICFLCQKENDEKAKADEEHEDDWKDFPIEETEIPEEIPMPLGGLDDEPEEEDEDEFTDEVEPDDFDYSADPNDYDDDEDEEEEDDDDDF